MSSDSAFRFHAVLRSVNAEENRLREYVIDVEPLLDEGGYALRTWRGRIDRAAGMREEQLPVPLLVERLADILRTRVRHGYVFCDR